MNFNNVNISFIKVLLNSIKLPKLKKYTQYYIYIYIKLYIY